MRGLVVAAVPFLCFACAESGERPADPTWVSLAATYARHTAPSIEVARGREVLPRGTFRPVKGSDLWMAPFSSSGWVLEGRGDARPALRSGTRSLEYAEPPGGNPRRLAPGTFTLAFGSLALRLGEASMPDLWTFEAPRDLGFSARGRWRIQTEGRTTDGFLVLPDRAVELPLEVPGPRVLRFAFSHVGGAGAGGSTPRLRVLHQGQRVLAEDIPQGGRPVGAVVYREVPLPTPQPGPRSLRFEVQGGDGLVGIHAPVVGPGPAADEGATPVRNVFLFLADTFRADTMAAYDAGQAVTPVLDHWAAEALLFRNAWSTSTWTLPAHASLFYGVHPYQHGAVEPTDRPGEALISLAEHFRCAGYRTAAVTDSAFVSARYGMDRGFEWFRELRPMDLAGTGRELAALLDHGDGRPLFLFVQSYQPHAPYRYRPATRRRLAALAGLPEDDGELRDLFREFQETLRLPPGLAPPEDLSAGLDFLPRLLQVEELERQFQQLARRRGALAFAEGGLEEVARRQRLRYQCAVRDYDRALGDWLGLLEERGLRKEGILLFTSDHGEFFGEHDQWQHHCGVWDEVLRVPLLLSAPGLSGGVRADAVSLVDLAPTLAALAGVSADPAWRGRDLLAPGASGSTAPVYAFDCPKRGDPHAIAVAPPLKLVFEAHPEREQAGTLARVYHLDQDPGEQRDLTGDADRRGRLRPLAERLRAEVSELMSPLGEAGSVGVDPALVEQLRALGYAVDVDGR